MGKWESTALPSLELTGLYVRKNSERSQKEEDRKRLDLCSWRDLVLSYTFK